MINAKQEFLDHIQERCVGGRTVRCAKITLGNTYNGDNKNHHILPIDYTTEDLQLFLAGIDQEYKNGYGIQNLYGMIWYTDGATWSQRGEYDGAEWWEFQEVPQIDLTNDGWP